MIVTLSALLQWQQSEVMSKEELYYAETEWQRIQDLQSKWKKSSVKRLTRTLQYDSVKLGTIISLHKYDPH